jgi:uncharacterized protein (DUF983 family)
MSEKQSIYACPHCGKKTFNPLTKALAGGMNTKGRVCQSCGRRAVNGKASAIVRTILMLVAVVIVFAVYLFVSSNIAYLIMIGAIAGAWLLSLLFDAFCCPLVKVVRNDAA